LLQEILREGNLIKHQGIVLKIDCEKAYDKVNLEFLFDYCTHNGFSDTFVTWIKQSVM
jgi:hypothetical protein